MNFLAHIYLSGDDDPIKIGNFIADSVKGKQLESFPENIQKGILLHRHIDSFTDSHSIVKTSKERLHKRYNHYDGVIIDILYDHFLAKNWAEYHHTPLKKYVNDFYNLLNTHFELLPERTKYMLPLMISNNWLYNYRTIEGIESVLIGMNRRTKNKSQMHLAVNDLVKHYDDFNNDFTEFFENLRIFSQEKINDL